MSSCSPVHEFEKRGVGALLDDPWPGEVIVRAKSSLQTVNDVEQGDVCRNKNSFLRP